MSGVKLPCVTDLAETAAVYAVCDSHYSEALRIVRAMTPAERRHYANRLSILLNLIDSMGSVAPGVVQ